MIEQVLMNVELGRFSPGDPNALAQPEALMVKDWLSRPVMVGS